MTQNISSREMRSPQPAREYAGYIAAAAYLAIVALNLWQMQEEHARGLPFDVVDAVVHVLLLLAIGGTTIFLYRLARRVQADVKEKAALVTQLRESETRFRSMFDNALEGMFQTTVEGRYIAANQALARMYGYESPQDLMKKLSDIGAQIYADPAQREELLRTLGSATEVTNFEFEAVRADGRTLWLRENVRAVRDERGKILYLEGMVEDISARHWSEQRRRLQHDTARVLSEAASVAGARPRILQSICEILDWDLGAVWDVEPAADVLRCVEIWHRENLDITEFEKANAGTRYPRGSGLAGEVWVSGQPKWIGDLKKEATFSNDRIAVKVGMNSSFGVPVAVRGEVRHVFEFFSPRTAPRDSELLPTLSLVGSQLGYLIERKLGEEALRKSEMRKAAIFDSTLDCIVSFDSEGRIEAFNPAAEREFGYYSPEILGRNVIELLVPESKREVHRRALALFVAAAGSGTMGGRRFEMSAVRRDGTEFPAEVTVSRIVIDKRPLFTACARDIAHRKRAERATAELAAVVENSNDAIVTCSLDGMVRSWNAGAERIYGYTAAEATGRTLDIVLPPDRLDEIPQMLTAVKRGESLANYETVRLRKDGRKIAVSVTDSPIRAADGRIVGVSSIARDITQRKRLEEDLLQSQKMDAVGRLAGGIAHDFNNILTAILGYSDLILSQSDERQPSYKHLAEIRKAAEFAAALTRQLLAFSRRQAMNPRVINLNETVHGLLKMVQRVIGEDIKVITRLRAESGRIKADPSQIEQVLLNLCVNGRDAMPHGGEITIATEDTSYQIGEGAVIEMPAGEYVRLTVSDTGSGIAPEIMRHVFEPFFTTKEKGQGTGLGLATCYGVVKQSGGHIAVESALGKGSTFTIYLPRVEESGAPSQRRENGDNLPGGRETILYVEDETTVRSLMAHVLRGLGYTVIEAGDGESARRAVEADCARPIDLLFSDVVLPDAGGRQLADWLRGRDRRTKTLFTSGYIDEKILQHHGLERGAPFLHKPFSPLELAKKVRETLDG